MGMAVNEFLKWENPKILSKFQALYIERSENIYLQKEIDESETL